MPWPISWKKRPAVILFKSGSHTFKAVSRLFRLCPIQGYYPDTTPAPPSSTLWHRWSPLTLQGLPQQNTYQTARQLADSILKALDQLLPGWSVCDGLDFRFAVRFHIQFFLANHGLPNLYACLQQMDPRCSVILIDSHLTPERVQSIATRHGFPAAQHLQCQSTFSLKRFKRKRDHWHAALPEEAPPANASPPRGVLVILPHTVHLDVLSPALQCLAEQGPVHVLPVHARVDVSALPEGRTLTLPALRKTPFMTQAIAHVTHLYATLTTRPIAEHDFCLNQLDLLCTLLEQYARFSDAMSALQPDTLIGCLEYNTYGALASLHKQKQSFRLLNVQHGFVSPTGSMDGLHFDQYFIWNSQTADVVMEDGFHSRQALRIVGNVRGESVAREMDSPMSPALLDLLAWKGESRLIGAYTQCLQAFSTVSLKRDYLGTLLDYLRHHPDVRLLVKKHPLEQDVTVDELVQVSGLSNRIRVVQADQLSLAESFKAVDVVTTVFSAVLLEALPLGKRVAAIDFEYTIATQAIPLPDDVPVLTNPADTHQWLAQSLQEVSSSPIQRTALEQSDTARFRALLLPPAEAAIPS